MFRRNSRRHQPLNDVPSASAQSAATRAFLSHQNATTNNLSSAAAATALRSHTPPPTVVEDVQTKRMLRRQSSNTSRTGPGSPTEPRDGQTLRRSSSVGSMTSRTFRRSSPNRPSTGYSDVMLPSRPLEPVPPIPTHLRNRPSVPYQPVNTRSSTHTPSPTPHKQAVESDGMRKNTVVSRPRSQSTTSPSPRPPSSSIEPDRPGSRSSVNFSYPRLVSHSSPSSSPTPDGSAAVRSNSPPAPRSLSPGAASSIRHAINQVGSKKVKTKPKRVAPQSAEGSHLRNGSERGPPSGTALQRDLAMQSAQEGRTLIISTEREEPTPSKSPVNSISLSESPPELENHASRPIIEPVSTTGLVNSACSSHPDPRPRPRPKKRPSTVQEEPEAEERAEAQEAPTGSIPGETAIGADIDSKATPYRPSQLVTPAIASIKASTAAPGSPLQQVSSKSSMSILPSPCPDRPGVAAKSAESSPNRSNSTSPNRGARFSDTLSVVGTMERLHEPPPRSMSPAKPALKHSLSPDRRTSLLTPSEISDVTSVASDEGSRSGSRKKAAKVSFDDSAEILGVAASPPTSPESFGGPPSPVLYEKAKARTNWFSFGRKKSGSRETTNDDDFDEVLKPRPALPSFGSVRAKRDAAEIAPVSESLSDNESSTSSSDIADQHELSSSGDHTIGGIFATEREKQLSTHEMPSIEDAPFHSEFGGGSANEKAQQDSSSTLVEPQKIDPPPVNSFDVTVVNETEITKSDEMSQNPPKSGSDHREVKHVVAILPEHQHENVPVIAIQPATPGLDDHRRSLEIQRMPGGFPAVPQNSSEVSPSVIQAVKETPPHVARTPIITTIDPAAGSVSTVPPSVDSDDSSDESVYSDAAETPDAGGEGFGSIDAIVDSPLPAPEEFPLVTPDSPTPSSRFKVSESLSPATSQGIHTTLPVQKREFMPQETESDVSRDDHKQQDRHMTLFVQKEAFPSNVHIDPMNWPLKDTSSAAGTTEPVLGEIARPMSANPPEGWHLRNTVREPQAKITPAPNLHSLDGTPRFQKLAKENRIPRPQSIQNTILPPQPEKTESTLRGPNNAHTGFPNSRRKPTMSFGGNTFTNPAALGRSPGRDGQIKMRRSMRSDVTSSSTLSLHERGSSAGSSAMRTTLRGPGSGARRSSSFSGHAPRTLSKISSLSRSSFKSRFDDISDDEIGSTRPARFISRFADSSDEDEPLPTSFRPVRGIPRRGDRDQDSTDLEDSSEDEVKPPMRPKPATSIQPNNPVVGSLTTPQDLELYLSQPKKRSLLSRITHSRKSRVNDGKIRKSELDSAARRDTPLERTRSEREQMKDGVIDGQGGSSDSPITSRFRPTSPKLHKRTTSESVSWSLSSTSAPPGSSQLRLPPNVFSVRPQSADNASRVNGDSPNSNEDWASRFRPKLENRRNTSSTISSGIFSEGAAIGQAGRKKRFPLLRKAFGLRD